MNNRAAANSIRFSLAISAEEYLAVYRGQAKDILVKSQHNKSIQFPANAVRGFLTRDGIYGSFEIQFDENNKLIRVVQLSTE